MTSVMSSKWYLTCAIQESKIDDTIGTLRFELLTLEYCYLNFSRKRTECFAIPAKWYEETGYKYTTASWPWINIERTLFAILRVANTNLTRLLHEAY